MIPYEARLSEYFSNRKAIGKKFCTVAETAEFTFESASKIATTNTAQDVAHNTFRAQLRIAILARAAALEELGPPPAVPI